MGLFEKLLPQREEVAYFMRRLYNKNLTTCSGGNISLRGPDNIILITPSALDKGELQPDQVVLVTLDGENLTPRYKPTIEVDLHTAIFRRRPEVGAVVHAHPVFATAFACMDMEILANLTNETYLLLREIVQAPFASPGTKELAELVADAMVTANVGLMKNHGAITLGATMLKAFDLMEVTELAAKMTFIAKTLNACRPLERCDIDSMRAAGLC